MLKPLTLSVGLAVALVASSVAMAGVGHGHHASPQALPAAQGVYPTAQGDVGCFDTVAPPRRHCLAGLMERLHRPRCYTYEWVLKKRRVGGLFGHSGGCGPTCDTGHFDAGVYPTAQYPSPQVYGAGQFGAGQVYGGDAYGAGQFGAGQYGAGQWGGGAAGSAPGMMEPAPADTDEAPPSPEVPTAFGRGVSLMERSSR